jgi:hypothetical protein
MSRLKLRLWLLPVVTAAVIFTGIGFLIYPAQPAQAAQLASSGTCAPGVVRVAPTTESGVALFVSSPAPNLVQVDVWDAFRHRRLYQQVTAKGSGAEFAMWGDYMYRYRQIDVTLRNGGVCSVSSDVLAELNSAHGWK